MTLFYVFSILVVIFRMGAFSTYISYLISQVSDLDDKLYPKEKINYFNDTTTFFKLMLGFT